MSLEEGYEAESVLYSFQEQGREAARNGSGSEEAARNGSGSEEAARNGSGSGSEIDALFPRLASRPITLHRLSLYIGQPRVFFLFLQ